MSFIKHLIHHSWSIIIDDAICYKIDKSINDICSVYDRDDTKRNLSYSVENKTKRYLLPSLTSILQPFQIYDRERIRCIVIFDSLFIQNLPSGIPCCNSLGQPINTGDFSTYVRKWRGNNNLSDREGLIDGSFCDLWYHQGVMPIYATPTNEAVFDEENNFTSISMSNIPLDYHKTSWNKLMQSILYKIVHYMPDMRIINMSKSMSEALSSSNNCVNVDINIFDNYDADYYGRLISVDPFTKINNSFSDNSKIEW